MLLGEYQHSVDDKGRLAVPKKFREEITDGAVLTKGLDGCLFLYPKNSWESLSRELQELPVTMSDARAFERYIFGGAVAVDFDPLGRIKIPTYLTNYAGLKKEAIMLGVSQRIEIWSKERWEEFAKQLNRRGEEIAEKLSKRGEG